MANPRPLSGLRLFRHSNPTSARQSSCSFSTTTTPLQQQHQPRPVHDPYALLSQPTWSIRTLLPPSTTTTTSSPTNHLTTPPPPPPPPSSPSQATTTTTTTPTTTTETLTPAQLLHIHRLSALPPPPTPASTTALLSTLHAQLHFVRDIQRVPTAGVAPLASIRDETQEGLREAAITCATLQQELEDEEVVGRRRRPRRRRSATKRVEEGVEDWDVLGSGGETVGRYFVVRSGGNGMVEGAGMKGE